VRRLAVLTLVAAAATAAVLGLDVAPAAAHICPIADQISVGQSSTIAVGVTVEGATVPDVTITIPAGLRLDRVDPKPGWSFARTGSTVRYHGGPISAYMCEYFSLAVAAPVRGPFGILVVQRTATGTVVSRSNPDPGKATDRLLGQIVYAGVKPPPVATGSSGLSVTTIAGIALVGMGLLAAGGLWFRARRDRRLGDGDDAEATQADETDREAELRVRLERFKKRTPDPPAPT
jgi:hypothetical protein